jgi:MFS transporter, DHA2 family, multidrug resistance protein
VASRDGALTVRRQWIIALSVTFGTMLGAIDAAVINVAIPQVRQSYGATVEQMTWLSTAFLIAAVLMMPLTGFLGRMVGQKKVYLACLALFVLASALCAVAPTFAWLVVLRALQGLGAGALQPTEHAILRQTFPPHKLGVAMGVFNMAVGIGPLTGPTLGGWIVDHFHWSWIFLINVPLGILGFLMVVRFVPADEVPAASRQRGQMDWIGIALLWTTLLALQYVLEEGQRRAWFDSSLIVALSLTAGVGAVAFVRRELTAPSPAVNLRVFRNPTYAIGSITNAIAMAIILSGAFLLPVFLQELLGYTAMASGIVQLPRTVVMVIAMPIVGRLYNRIPPRIAVFLGLAITALGQFLLSRLTLHSDASDTVLALVLQGLGMSVVIITLSTLSLSRVPKPELGDATGLAALLRQVGISTGLAMMATILARSTPVGAELAVDHAPAAEAMLQGRVLAFQHTFTVGAMLYVGLLPLAWFIRAPKHEDARSAEPSVDG